MTSHATRLTLIALLLLLLAGGCGNAGAQFGDGVDLSDERWAEYGVEPERRADEGRDRQRDGNARRGGEDGLAREDRGRGGGWNLFDSQPSRTEDWGDDRQMPSDSMPSRTERWGGDRDMPGDALPSRTEGWGSDRWMPSDSMPSRTESWGSDRRMPSDSWGSDSVFDE